MKKPLYPKSLLRFFSFSLDSDAAKIKKKDNDKRQISPPLYYQLPQSRFQNGRPITRTYFPPPRYQYSSAFRNTAPIRPTKQFQSAYTGSPKIFNAQAQRRYTSYYYPHRTHYRDWSRKLVEASAYARRVQDMRKKELLQKQQSDPSSAGIKLFVTGVNRNGNVVEQWIDHGKIQKPNDLQKQGLLKHKPSQENFDGKIPNVEFLGSSRTMQQSPVSTVPMDSRPPTDTALAPKRNPAQPQISGSLNAKTSAASPTQSHLGGNVIGDINRNLQTQTRANSFLDKGSTKIPKTNEAILSDNLGGAALGPNAHSLLQPTIAQQAVQVGALRNAPGRSSEIKQSNTNAQPKADSIQSFGSLNPGDIVNKGSPGHPNQQHPDTTATYNMQANAAPNLSAVLEPPSQTKADLSNSITKGTQISSMASVTKNMRPANAVTLDATNIDKTTAQMLNAGLASTSASRPQATVLAQPSTSNAVSVSRINVPGNVNRVQTQLDKELALKNILFPPPAAASNQVYGTASNAFQKQQQLSQGQADNMTPTFPAFRYNVNLPRNGQSGFNSYRRQNIPRAPSAANSKKSIVPQRNTVPYKSSFPLMLHKISPYFKMKRNLKQAASEQAKARKRLLELQRKYKFLHK